jgi:hypothetical protein
MWSSDAASVMRWPDDASSGGSGDEIVSGSLSLDALSLRLSECDSAGLALYRTRGMADPCLLGVGRNECRGQLANCIQHSRKGTERRLSRRSPAFEHPLRRIRLPRL